MTSIPEKEEATEQRSWGLHLLPAREAKHQAGVGLSFPGPPSTMMTLQLCLVSNSLSLVASLDMTMETDQDPGKKAQWQAGELDLCL